MIGMTKEDNLYHWRHSSCKPPIWLIVACLALYALSYVRASPESNLEQVAIQYIQKLSSDRIDLGQDTAISDHCSIQRRKEIREQLDFLRKTHFRKGDQFSLDQQKIDGAFAGVLLRSENSRAPLGTRIHAIALIRKGQAWLAAPLPGSFANTGYGYDEDVEKSVTALERWMAQEKVTLETLARKTAENNLLAAILKEEQLANLNKLSPKQAVTNFLNQVHSKNLLGVLASMGAASSELEDSLESTTQLISQGLLTQDNDNSWQLLSNPSSIYHLFQPAPKAKELTVGFWNPLSRNYSTFLNFQTHQEKKGGPMFVRLPQQLKAAFLPEYERRNALRSRRPPNHDKLAETFPSTLFKAHPASSFPDDHDELTKQFLAALNSQKFADCLKLLPRKGEFFGKATTQHKALNQLSQLWNKLYQLQTNPRRDLPLIETDDLCLLPLQYAKSNRPGEFQTVKIWFFKDPSSGWHLIPEELLREHADQKINAQIQELTVKMRETEKEQREKHSKLLMSKVTVITPPLELPAVTDELAEQTLTRFRKFLRTKDTASALAQCAVIQGTSNTQTLKTFNYAIRGASDQSELDHLLGIKKEGKWSGISIRTESKTSGEYDYPLYLIVNSDGGPKILLDIDLRHATNKGRKLLNNRNMDKLEKALAKESLAHVQAIFDNHHKLATDDIKASEPLKD